MENVRVPDPFLPEPLARWQAAAATTTLAALTGSAASMVVVVPHADDETLGCGGLIAAAASAGIAVTVAILTDGAASHPGSKAWPPARLARRRRSEARAAVKCLAGDRAALVFIGAPDGELATCAGVGAAIPIADLYVTCWRGDPHPDHRAAFVLAQRAAQKAGAPLLAFPLWVLMTPDAVPALPLFRLNVSDQLTRKRLALTMHQSQLGGLIADCEGFVLSDDLQRLFLRADELYLRLAPAILV